MLIWKAVRYMADIFDLFKKISQSNNTKSAKIEYIVVGLGNPGSKYTNTRHNAGFLAIDYVANKTGVKIDRAKFDALVASTDIGGKGVLLMKPQTFMNLSGKAVAEAARFYKIAPENIVVISDDINLDVGRLRVRRNGSDGGHNGLKNISENLASNSYPRIKVGVGMKPHPDYDLVDWVLSTFENDEIKKLSDSFPKIYEGIENIIVGNIDAAMQICNTK